MKEEKKAVLITFSVQSQKFESNYERNTFFRKLYGWKQEIRKEVISSKKPQEKVYTYHRDGILDEMPHEKVDQSSFIVPEDEIDKIMKFFKEWHNKVMWKTFKVLLEEDELRDMFEEFEEAEEEEVEEE